jgi:hypothetical protein
MSRADSLIAKVNSSLRKVSPPDRTAYKRVLARTGDSLIGRTVATHTDTLLDPQPYFHRVGREHLPGGHALSETVIDGSNKTVIADDWEFVLSPTAISLQDLQNKDVVIVLKDAAGSEEPFRYLDHEAGGISGTDVVFTVYMRSLKRP